VRREMTRDQRVALSETGKDDRKMRQDKVQGKFIAELSNEMRAYTSIKRFPGTGYMNLIPHSRSNDDFQFPTN